MVFFIKFFRAHNFLNKIVFWSFATMEDEMNHDELLQEIEDVQLNIESLRAQKAQNNTPRAMSSFFISTLQATLGLIFLGLFFLGIVVRFNPIITTVFFIGSFLGLFPFITDIFTKKEYFSLRAIGVVTIAILSGSYVLLWMWVLNPYVDIVFFVLSLIFFSGIVFFLIHSYLAYLRRIANDEIKLLSIIGGIGFILFLVQLLHSHFLLITIYLVILSLFMKGIIDFTERFRAN